ncbi:putative transporter [Rhizodiscina lignyota]|uniref:Transporter n=1 Tax=Rhizodiscina lignyota TaxID=1504668 RepID=A0A9P4IBZ0_9PEZI|nr:putative transporter [Rhizodiscina lignyota]
MGKGDAWFKAGRPTQLAITYTCLSAFVLFGWDQGVFGGLVTNPDFLDIVKHPDPGFLGIIVSIYNIGCFLGCAMNFYVGKRFGRREAIGIAMAFISVGGLIQCSTYSTAQLMVGRIITGFGVGIDTSTVPMYQAELCKREHRGRLVTTEVLFTALGVSGAYFFDFGLSFVDGPVAWRLPIALQIPMAFSVAALVYGLPETPRYLVQKGRIDEAVAVMSKVWNAPADDPYIVAEKEDIIKAIHLEEVAPFKWRTIFKRDPMQTGWRVFLACLVLFMNQWAGINVIVFYAATVLEGIGLSRNASIVAGGCLNLAFAVGSLVPALGADKLGRRKPMMFGAFGMGVSMMMVAILLSFQGKKVGHATSEASIAFLITYMICFGASLNAIPWCYSTEILPLKIRAQGTALAVFNNWIWVFLIVMVTPTMVANIGWKTYLVFMAFNFSFVPAIYFLFPETKGLSLEEIDYIFLKGDELPAEERQFYQNSVSGQGAGAGASPETDSQEVEKSATQVEKVA